MDLANPWVLMLAPPLVVFIWWARRRSLHPMSPQRQRALLIVRCVCVALALLALAGPAIRSPTSDQATIFIMDHSRSQGAAGMRVNPALSISIAFPVDPESGVVLPMRRTGSAASPLLWNRAFSFVPSGLHRVEPSECYAGFLC